MHILESLIELFNPIITSKALAKLLAPRRRFAFTPFHFKVQHYAWV